MPDAEATQTSTGRRLFFALWPQPAVANRIAALTRELGVNGRAIPADRIHLTVLFLGATSEALETDIVGRLPSVMPYGPIDMLLDTVGCFRRAGVAWVAPGAMPPGLADLHAALSAAATAAGLTPERREFRPHVTLARRTRGRRSGSIDGIRWVSTELTLVESVAAERGVDYRVRRRWPLGV